MFKRFKGRLLQIYWNAKIRSKITFFNSLLFGALTIVLLLFNNTLTQKLAVHYTSDNARQSDLIIQEKIEYLLSNSEDMAALIDNNDIVQKLLLVETPRERMDRIYPISNVLNRSVQNSSAVNTIVLYPADRSAPITSLRVNLDKLAPGLSEEVWEEMEDVWDGALWSDMHQSDYQIFHDERATITLTLNIISIYTGKIVGLLVLDIPESRIAEAYKSETGGAATVLIVNHEGDIVSASDKQLLMQNVHALAGASTSGFPQNDEELRMLSEEGAKVLAVQGRKYLVDAVKIEKLGWWVVRLDPLHAIYAQTRQTTIFSFLMALIVSLFAALCVRRIATGLTRPLTKLSQIMEGDPLKSNVSLSVPGDDEVGMLNRSFQRMRLNMQILIERIKHEQQQQMQINMSSLQTQINPHFLYNTLDSVCALLQLGRIDDASHMLKNIELFYRGTLSKGNTIISIRDEIFVTRQFIDIQRYRYEGTLRVSVQISEEIMDRRIPKLTLQPIVENAIYHGLKNGGKDGCIEISESHDDGEIVISIKDNGVGFCPGSLEMPHGGRKGGGFGLYNTQRRLKYYFGEAYGLQIESRIGHGTIVRLIIPNQSLDQSISRTEGSRP